MEPLWNKSGKMIPYGPTTSPFKVCPKPFPAWPWIPLFLLIHVHPFDFHFRLSVFPYQPHFYYWKCHLLFFFFGSYKQLCRFKTSQNCLLLQFYKLQKQRYFYCAVIHIRIYMTELRTFHFSFVRAVLTVSLIWFDVEYYFTNIG